MNERILLQDKPAFGEIVVYWTLMGALFAGMLLFAASMVRAVDFFRNLFVFLAAATLVLALLRIGFDLAERELSLYTLTNKRLIIRRGLIGSRERIIPTESIQDIDVRRPLVGQILNYGTLRVKAPGWSIVSIDRVPEPDKWREQIWASRR